MAVVALGEIQRIPLGEGRNFDLGDRVVAVFRTRGGGVYAVQAACPHRGGPLADGLVGGCALVCPLHGHKFDLASGDAIDHACGALKTYPVTVDEDGSVSVLLEEDS